MHEPQMIQDITHINPGTREHIEAVLVRYGKPAKIIRIWEEDNKKFVEYEY